MLPTGYWPGFIPNEEFKVTIVCMEDHYKIFVNDVLLTRTFPYRWELSNAKYLWFQGGSKGFKWGKISMPGSAKSGEFQFQVSEVLVSVFRMQHNI